MADTKIFSSVSSLSDYCFDRYGVLIPRKKLSKLLALYFMSYCIDVNSWLKVNLIKLGCLHHGCIQSSSLGMSVPIHMNWGQGEIVSPLRLSHLYKPRFFGADRHRAGHDPAISDDLFNGRLEILPVSRDER